jgi:hypothetical protein
MVETMSFGGMDVSVVSDRTQEFLFYVAVLLWSLAGYAFRAGLGSIAGRMNYMQSSHCQSDAYLINVRDAISMQGIS